MSAPTIDWRVRLHWVTVATLRTIGWPGVLGACLLAGAVLDQALGAWTAAAATEEADGLARPASGQGASLPRPSTVHMASSPSSGPAAGSPDRGGEPRLIGLAEASAQQHVLGQLASTRGVAWPAGDYRVVAETDSRPAAYEIRAVLKGQYPALRDFLGDALSRSPAPAMRSLEILRPSTDGADVEAHVVLAYFLVPGAVTEERHRAASEPEPGQGGPAWSATGSGAAR